MDTVSPTGFSERGFFYQASSTSHQANSLFEWIAGNIFNPSVFHQDVPVSDKNEESNFLEEFSICLIWPPLDLEFIQRGNPEGLSRNFGHYLDNFIPHYSEPNSPPPNQA